MQFRFFIRYFFYTLLGTTCFWLFVSRFGESPKLPRAFYIKWKIDNNMVNYPIAITLKGKNYIWDNLIFNIGYLYSALEDPRVKGLLIEIDSYAEIPLDTAQELIEIINSFKKKNKEVKVIAKGINGIGTFCVFASANSRVLLNDSIVEVTGFEHSNIFSGKHFEKKKKRVFAAREGEYKGGVLRSISNGFDNYSASNWRGLVNDCADQAIKIISEAYNSSYQDINKIFLQGYFTTQDFLSLNLSNPDTDTQHIAITIDQYSQEYKNCYHYLKPNVAVVGIDFIIMESNILNEVIASLKRLPNSIKVLLLYISSPGGETNASKKLCEALQEVKKSGKYIIAYLQFAASAAYQSAIMADKIFARPASEVGSIGAFLSIVELKEYLKKKGHTFDRIYSHSKRFNEFEITPKQEEFLNKALKDSFIEFFDLVQHERKIDKKTLLDIARGQIFSGKASKKLGLIDSLSGIIGAMDLAYAICDRKFLVYYPVLNHQSISNLIQS
jgi:signal peptide peptidase SppA